MRIISSFKLSLSDDVGGLVTFAGNKSLLGILIGLSGLLVGFQCLEAATLLGQSTEVRDSDEDEDEDEDDDDKKGFSLSGLLGFSSEDTDPVTHSYTETNESSSEENPLQELEEALTEDVPEDWLPGRLRTSLEIGLQHWEPSSSSGQYSADYDIDPVTVTTFDSSVRVKSWVLMFDYKTSLTDPENMKNLLAQISRIEPGAGMWWALYVETGQVEGTARTVDELGNRVNYPVDTEWNRLGIELRTYYGIYAGLVWEDMTMPVIHTFNNDTVAFAVFDDQTRTRTLSLALGYDKARYLMNDFKEGGAWAWSLEGSFGLGWLDYSEDEVRGMIEGLGYKTESIELLLAGAIDGRLGYTYSKKILGTETQCYVGGRLRAAGWMNVAGDAPDSGMVGLDTDFWLFSSGVFARLSFQW